VHTTPFFTSVGYTLHHLGRWFSHLVLISFLSLPLLSPIPAESLQVIFQSDIEVRQSL